QQQLGLAAPPACTTCHATNAGGIGTVVKPFGIYLRSRGLQPFDETSLRNALLADIAEHHSSNSSGISDIDALKAGEDPNAPGGATGPTPAYGCSSSGSANLLTLLALAAWRWWPSVCSRRRSLRRGRQRGPPSRSKRATWCWCTGRGRTAPAGPKSSRAFRRPACMSLQCKIH